MNIVHLELAGFFTQHMNYQTNLLAKYNQQDGHRVTIISTNFCWKEGRIEKVKPCDMALEDGIRLIRMPYTNPSLSFRCQKIRKVRNLYQILVEIQPDVILSHGPQYWSILDVIRYKKDHPEVKLYADTHADSYTSGTNWLSLHVLNRIFYRRLVQKALPYLEKYFYISDETKEFSMQNYGVPESLMEFYPLGGVLPTEDTYQSHRSARRAELAVTRARRNRLLAEDLRMRRTVRKRPLRQRVRDRIADGWAWVMGCIVTYPKLIKMWRE